MKKHKILAVALCMLFACLCLFGCVIDNGEPSKKDVSKIKNVIVIIGDGMGVNHIANAKTYFGDENVFPFQDNYVCSVTTCSLAGATTDSAAAATALATGNKAVNGNVSKLNGIDLQSIMSIAQANGKKTGIITSDHLYGATPAAFSSHATGRKDYEKIVAGQAVSGIDIMVGKNDSSGYYAAQKDLFESNGYKLISKYDDLFEAQKGQKLVANVKGLRSTYNTELSGQKYINEIVKFTLDALDCENGFCLMIENAYIDKRSHDNDLYGALCEVRSLSDTIKEVLSFCQGRDDTVVFVTADHETGGLALANSKEEINNGLYSRTSHSPANVSLYCFGYDIGSFEVLDNTDIFKMCKMFVTKNPDEFFQQNI